MRSADEPRYRSRDPDLVSEILAHPDWRGPRRSAGCPGRGGVLSDIEVQHFATTVLQYDEFRLTDDAAMAAATAFR